MSQHPGRVTLFDAWAARYDTAVTAGEPSFPFAGYDEVLATTVRLAGARPGARILDLGIGTGNLGF